MKEDTINKQLKENFKKYELRKEYVFLITSEKNIKEFDKLMKKEFDKIIK